MNNNMNNNEVALNIDGLQIKANKGITILQAALENNIYIPNLCYSPYLKPGGACRLCMVEIDDGRLVTSCETPVEQGMNVVTENSKINNVRKLVAELLIANHEVDCLTCAKNDQCKLQEIAAYLGIEKEKLGNLRRVLFEIPKDTSNPFFDRDLGKCILCGICVRICRDILGVSAIDFGFRGYETRITTFADKPILESSCVSCGECVVGCPVGALVPKNTLQPSREVKTICPYCGVGCGIYLGVRGNTIVNVRGDSDNPVNKGNLCVKGRFGYNFINHPKRLTTPLIKRNGKFIEVTWDEALDYIARNISKYVGDSFAAIASAKCSNEENYVFQKFTRAVMGTNNIDHCARLCHVSTVAGLGKTLGSGAMTNTIAEIADSACIFAIGTNTTSTHPITALGIIKAVQNGGKLIVANPREIDLCRHADIWLQHCPGTDVVLLMGMMRQIVDRELFDSSFVNDRCENFNLFKKSLREFDLDSVEKITGVNKDKIIEAAKTFASSKTASILYSMGITQHSHGTDNVIAVSNLALLTGNIGKPSAGVNPLRGQNNVQGSCDMGCLPDVYPGYQSVEDYKILEKFQRAWDCKLNKSSGLTLPQIIESAHDGKIRAMYIVGENLILSEPNSSHVIESLEKLEFAVVQDIFLTETALLADVVLPACTFAERDGTFTNTERRVQLFQRAIKPLGSSKPDWWITCEISKRLGAKGFDFHNTKEILEEIASLTPIYGGIFYDRLEKGGLQWPCSDAEDNGTSILHMNQFATENGKGKFLPLSYKPSAELPDNEYPFILTTGRSLYQYHTGTMTRMVEGLNKLYGHDFVEINPKDASDLDINHDEFVRVISRRGEVKAKAKLTDALPKGVIFMTFHFAETPTNILTNSAMDPISNTPELKFCAVKIEKDTE